MSIQFPMPKTVFLRNFNTRMEKHGDDDIPAMDLALSVIGGNELLDMLHPDLRVALFKPLSETAGELPLPTDDLPSIRFAQMKTPIGFDLEHAGMTLHIAYGTGGKSDMVVADVKLTRPSVETLIEGGSVELRFTLSSTDVNEKVLGKLALLQKHELTITLKPAEVSTSDMEAAKAKAKAEAEALFNQKPAGKTPEQALIDTQATA